MDENVQNKSESFHFSFYMLAQQNVLYLKLFHTNYIHFKGIMGECVIDKKTVVIH